MKSLPWVSWVLIACSSPLLGQTWAEKLGFPPDKKVLILHADDIGMSYEGNQSAKECLLAGDWASCSAMAPCPWFNEFAAWCKEHPGHDVGLHITLNAEWKYYRWPPVAERSQVPGLVDKDGCLHGSNIATALRAKPEEIEREIRAQIEKAMHWGLRPSHLDSHMGTCFAKPEFIEVYLKLSQEYKIPAFVPAPSEKLIARLKKEGFPFTARHVQLLTDYPGPKIDDFHVLGPAKSYDDKKAQFLALIGSLDPGVTQIVFHPSVETETMKQITSSWPIRAWEDKLFRDPDVKKYFAENGIIQSHWKDLAERFARAGLK